jgi:Kef-type K+ transport system membrane component KefB
MIGSLTGWDFFVAFCIVAFDEYIIKKLICKSNEKYKAIYTYAPIVLGLGAYIVMALIGHTEILPAILHGLLVGFTAMGSYDVILRVGRENALKGIEETGEAIKEAVEDGEKKEA